ncbi:endonuclease/exonuclease/phosphatase family protein [Streptomyces microflavus]|uniref:endonuclease/exonuclease/phosphatase family protein n=1 Tax=Streptomyces microflavus TaxID=1919 RepID=UPI0029BD59D8|nr:endonuclease/exonuclease/phosphatase family protein [Streptomyces microflavus]MDX2404417.1 endonuclease/exonuclease/phosphatase family protein [Streptomyces microflavus]
MKSAGTGRAVRAATVVLVAAAALVLVTLARKGPEKPAAPAEVRVLHYNLCGAAAACPWNSGGSGPGTSVARVVGEASAFEPDLITLNEICATQYKALLEQLEDAGRRMHGTYASSQDNVPNCGPTGEFGTAVLSRGTIEAEGPDYRRFSSTGSETYTNGGRTVPVRRGLLCAPTRFAGKPLLACTAHTNAKAPEQLREIRDRLAEGPVPRETPVLLAGDLNLQPNEPALGFLYAHASGVGDRPTGRFLEGDETDRAWFSQGATGGVVCTGGEPERCRNGEPTAGERKIDYVFADTRHFSGGHSDARMFDESDHAMLTAVFTLGPDA